MSAESSSNKKMKRRTGNEEDAPAEAQPRTAPKRQRVSRACDQCRAAREKCDGIHPLCFPCASQNRKCTWEEPKKKRGVQTGYIRTLELSLGWIFDKIPGSEEALHGLLTHEGGQGRDLLVGKDTIAGNRLHRRWRKSMVQQEIDRVLSGSTASSAKSAKTSPAVDESESSADEAELPLKEETSSAANPAPIMAIPESMESMTAALHPDRLVSNGPPELPAGLADLPIRQRQLAQYASNTFKLPSNCWRLLDIYFSYTHCWFPILEKGMIHKACWSYPGEGLDMTKEELFQSGLHAELWAALAIAAYQDDASHSGQAHGDRLEGRLQPDEIYNAARRLIPSEDRDFDARHVNAILLLALVDIGRRKYMAAWILVGLATRVALALNLPARPAGDGYRRLYHTYMACFMLDSLIASLLEKPPHLRPSDIDSSVPSGEDEPDEWDIWMPCQGFGTTQHSSSPRSPAHSMSSFAALFGVHRVYCTVLSDTKIHVDRNELYMTEMRKALNGNQTRRPLVDYITNGGIPPYQVPSIYLLRLAFVCFTVQAQSYSEPLMSAALQCIEELLLLFGSAVPPLFGLYMELLGRQCNPEALRGDTRDRWKKAQASVDSIWASSGNDNQPFPMVQSHEQPAHLSHGQSDVIYPCPPNTNIPGVVQQVHTTSPRHTDPRVDPASLIRSEVYHEASLSAMANFSTMSRPTQPLDLVDHPNSTTTAVGGRFDLSDIPPQGFHGHGRPSFSSAAFDYDTILDDIASLDRSDRMQSDPQFMANLGFAPGSDLAELLAHDFTSMP
ncbi:hypothetical protein PFICI_15081 [Pestalotiopsis fici W106-1]|uniref:Zn(2)-C6 fungal-type domain-containing protein n=1 Tax=Pestalotiopsis fici (strain W106-1 / CGMCC3.15140) TaxID=1229662 RepID=W3WJZ9_PESFW|nr:uncharacterized protein PFICI_15081 [Pestalotiopsis fici W106-1]ETS73136.1 hypothetical protein PFICI_15081 [Pestalotiopsis fici W106-1]